VGLSARQRNDSLMVSSVEWNSPAWNAGIRSRDIVLEINNERTSGQKLEALQRSSKAGDSLQLLVLSNGTQRKIALELSKKSERSFEIGFIPHPDALQTSIQKDWLRQ